MFVPKRVNVPVPSLVRLPTPLTIPLAVRLNEFGVLTVPLAFNSMLFVRVTVAPAFNFAPAVANFTFPVPKADP